MYQRLAAALGEPLEVVWGMLEEERRQLMVLLLGEQTPTSSIGSSAPALTSCTEQAGGRRGSKPSVVGVLSETELDVSIECRHGDPDDYPCHLCCYRRWLDARDGGRGVGKKAVVLINVRKESNTNPMSNLKTDKKDTTLTSNSSSDFSEFKRSFLATKIPPGITVKVTTDDSESKEASRTK